VHQGALLETVPLAEPSLEDILSASPQPLLVVLDQVTDPHNVGAILRTAAAFGVAALIMTRRHSPPSSGALAKSASGALELVPVLHVPNLARALGELGDHGVLRLGLDGAADEPIEDFIRPETMPPGAIALVLGAEERGLRRLSRDSCDRLVRLTTPGALASLNVSNAAAIAMHHVALMRRQVGKGAA
jgi:23S rRNA (guanosine2251-2'-O)-methyltransferase